MAHVRVTEQDVVVELAPWERAVTRCPGARLPRSAVRGVELLDDARQALRGVRIAGVAIPGLLHAGLWLHLDGQDLVVVRTQLPGLRVSLTGQPWRAVLLTSRDADAVAAGLR